MRKAEVFAADSNPACDRPFYRPLHELELQVRLHRAVQIGPRSFHLIPLVTVLDCESGYDRSVSKGPVSSMLTVWQIRESSGMGVWQMGHEGMCRSQSKSTKNVPTSNGFPDRMHIRREAAEFEKSQKAFHKSKLAFEKSQAEVAKTLQKSVSLIVRETS